MGDRFATLPDYLRPRLALVFVGINPGLYSVQHGHYFARKTSRFWPAFSRSVLSASVRTALGRDTLVPEDDTTLTTCGIGFTDVVKRPSRNAAELRPADFETWSPRLLLRLRRYRPRVVCFHGLTAFRAFVRYALKDHRTDWTLGPQPMSVGPTRLFVVPNPSPANAHFTPKDQVIWYDRLAAFLKTDTEGGMSVDPDQAFAPVLEALRRDRKVGQARMFGALGLKVGEKFFAMLYKGALVVKISAGRAAALVASGEGRYFDPGHGRLMKEWIAVGPEHAARWLRLAEEAKDFVSAATSGKTTSRASQAAKARPSTRKTTRRPRRSGK
jgi:TDG/mug DNA glycosylase family protein